MVLPDWHSFSVQVTKAERNKGHPPIQQLVLCGWSICHRGLTIATLATHQDGQATCAHASDWFVFASFGLVVWCSYWAELAVLPWSWSANILFRVTLCDTKKPPLEVIS